MAPNINYPPEASEAAIRPLTIQASSQATMVLWSPSARDIREVFPNDKPSIPSGREDSTAYAVGLQEKISILTNSGNAWKWRRIVFTHKGPLPLGESFEGPRYYSTTTDAVGRETYFRTLAPLPPTSKEPLTEYLFKGQGEGGLGIQDWVDIMTAPMDTTRIKVMHDHVTHIQSGNDSGVMRTYKRWHPVRKNIVYGDEEIGNQMLSSYMSTQGRPGIGDIYVFDIITSLSNSTSDALSFTPTASWYWHEK